MSTSHKLWLGFGTLIGLLLVSLVSLLILHRVAQSHVELLANEARDRSATARELEINLLGHMLNVRTFVQNGNQIFRSEAEAKAAEVDRHLAEYARLAMTPVQREFAAEFTQRWQALLVETRRALSDPRGAAAAMEQVITHRIQLERFLVSACRSMR